MSNALETLTQSRAQTAMTQVESSRAIQEVQAQIISAKRFPRDPDQAVERMLKSCQRQSLAQSALYEYTKGQKIEGPSIRLAEMMAQNWGNLEYGIRELEQRKGESEMMAFCIDLETNVRQSRIFTVKHERDVDGSTKKLTSGRDIYENNANLGARRVRACILGIIPGDVTDDCVAAVNKTLATNKIPLQERINTMLTSFAELKVTPEQIQTLLGHNLASVTESEWVRLQKIYRSLVDGIGSVEEFFKSKPQGANSLLKPKTGPVIKKPEGAQ